MFERNLKRLLAYSSVAQVGYVLLGASLGSVMGLTAGIVHMFNHALAKGALFLAVASLGARIAQLQLEGIRGAAQRMPWTMAAFVVSGLSLIGVPGTAGFISKWYLILASLREGMVGVALVAVVLVSSLMTVVYIWRVVEAAYFGAVSGSAEQAREAPWPLLTATWIAALANIYFGVFPRLPLTLSTQAATTLLEHLP